MRSPVSGALTVEHEQHIEIASKRQRMKLIVVDRECRVLLDTIDPSDRELRMLLSDDRTHLRGDLADVVHSLINGCVETNERHSHIRFFNATQFVRVTFLNGSRDPLFAVNVEAFRGGDSLSRAVRKYRLTPREIDVLGLILEGESAVEIAQALKIAETTVQGYYKRLLSKTQSRNRPAMVANVLDWPGSRSHRERAGDA